MANQLAAIKHVVQLMLENRSFDQMLGFLYAGSGNRSPTNQPFEGLTGNETNPDDATQTRVIDGTLVKVLSWYDNEWGFSNRMLDMTLALAGAK